jgi:hypothetical protein
VFTAHQLTGLFMFPKLFLGLLSLALAGSPYISKITYLNERFQLLSANRITGQFAIFVVGLGIIGLVICFYSFWVGRKFGAFYIVIGMLFLFIGFFYNQEALPRPLPGVFMGGDLFFAFAVSGIMTISGAVLEWLT